MIPVFIWCDYEPVCCWLRTPGINLTRVYIRCLYFCFGVFWITRDGDIDREARVTFFNHQTIIDGPLIYMFRPFLVIGMAKLRNVPLFGRILIGAQSVFVDRTKSEGQAAEMKKIMEDDSRMALAMSPEGKTTLGDFMLAFRTGGFLAAKPAQPVTIRYEMYGAFGGATIAWIVGGFREWIWRVMCTPFIIARVHFLPVLKGDEYYRMTPQERALTCQLAMANDLGVLATNRDTRTIFPSEEVLQAQEQKTKKD
jgi:1-acyl-sn-glycerol-3-phosphate acyltransferase